MPYSDLVDLGSGNFGLDDNNFTGNIGITRLRFDSDFVCAVEVECKADKFDHLSCIFTIEDPRKSMSSEVRDLLEKHAEIMEERRKYGSRYEFKKDLDYGGLLLKSSHSCTTDGARCASYSVELYAASNRKSCCLDDHSLSASLSHFSNLFSAKIISRIEDRG